MTPVVVNGVMYVTSANDAFALDARTGRVLWHHARALGTGLLDDAAAHHNRGVGSLARLCIHANRRRTPALPRRPFGNTCDGTSRTRIRRSIMERPALPWW